MDKRSDERIAQSIQKVVKESMLSDSPSFERAWMREFYWPGGLLARADGSTAKGLLAERVM